MRTLLLLLLACALVTGCVQAVDPTRFQTPTPTPPILAEVPFATIDVFAETDTSARAVLPGYVGTPEVERASEYLTGHKMIELDVPTVFVIEESDPTNPAVAALPVETQAALLATDFDRALVFVLLHNGMGLDDFSFVQRIVLDKEGTRVQVEDWYKPNPSGIVSGFSMPFHVVRVQRSDLPADWTPERYPVRAAVTAVSGDLRPPTPSPVDAWADSPEISLARNYVAQRERLEKKFTIENAARLC